MTKKNDDTEKSIDDHDDDQAISSLADAIADVWEEEFNEESDPFDQYTQSCRSKFCHDHHEFSGRLRRGYRAIIAELHQTSSA